VLCIVSILRLEEQHVVVTVMNRILVRHDQEDRTLEPELLLYWLHPIYRREATI